MVITAVNTAHWTLTRPKNIRPHTELKWWNLWLNFAVKSPVIYFFVSIFADDRVVNSQLLFEQNSLYKAGHVFANFWYFRELKIFTKFSQVFAIFLNFHINSWKLMKINFSWIFTNFRDFWQIWWIFTRFFTLITKWMLKNTQLLTLRALHWIFVLLHARKAVSERGVII